MMITTNTRGTAINTVTRKDTSTDTDINMDTRKGTSIKATNMVNICHLHFKSKIGYLLLYFLSKASSSKKQVFHIFFPWSNLSSFLNYT